MYNKYCITLHIFSMSAILSKYLFTELTIEKVLLCHNGYSFILSVLFYISRFVPRISFCYGFFNFIYAPLCF